MNKPPRPYLLLALFALISAHSFAQSQAAALCEDVHPKKGLRITAKNFDQLEDLCICLEVKQVTIKKVPVLHLPACMAEMDSLQIISFEKSPLRAVPPIVFECAGLQELDLSYTGLYVLPDEVTGLNNLRTLNLTGTFIETLPVGLEHITRIDMRNIDISQSGQKALRAMYPNTEIYFSSPCKCD